MKLDTRFLSVHPATALWWQQREQCRRCVHMEERVNRLVGREPAPIMTCMAVGLRSHKQQPVWNCADARLPGGHCGPDAALFNPRP